MFSTAFVSGGGERERKGRGARGSGIARCLCGSAATAVLEHHQCVDRRYRAEQRSGFRFVCDTDRGCGWVAVWLDATRRRMLIGMRHTALRSFSKASDVQGVVDADPIFERAAACGIFC